MANILMEPGDLNSVNAEYALATVKEVVAMVENRNDQFMDEHGSTNMMLWKLQKWFVKVQHGLEKAVKECKNAGI